MDSTQRAIYMDHSATTPVAPQVVDVIVFYWEEAFGNPSSAHIWGREAAAALEGARAAVADRLGCRPSEIVFTGSGSEADNLALRGAAWAAHQAGRGNHLVTTPVEHHAVGVTVDQLCDLWDFEATRVPVDSCGRVDPDDVRRALRPDTILVSVMAANNEVGTVQPIAEIGAICREREVLFHTDAVQAGGRLELNVDDLGVDFLALSAHKFYGPKGVGVLYARRGVDLLPALTGGGHERGRRPGTENVPGAVGLAEAFDLAEARREQENARLEALRDRLIEGVLANVPDVRLTGHPTQRLAHHASFAFRDVEGASLVVALDLEGIAASSGAACAEGEPEPSFVLQAMGFSPRWGIGALRFSLGRSNSQEDVDAVLEVLPAIVARLREEG